MKVLLLCCKGFETMEFAPFVDVMGWARNDYHYDVEVITCGFSKTVVSTFGIPVTVDQLVEEINAEEYDALAIPGGFEEFGFYEEAYSDRCLQLIRDGAILVRNADDVLEALSEFLPHAHQASQHPQASQAPDPDVPKYSIEESLVMLHVDEDGISIDDLVRKTKLPVGKVNALAMSLRLKGFVKFLPGNRISLLTA